MSATRGYWKNPVYVACPATLRTYNLFNSNKNLKNFLWRFFLVNAYNENGLRRLCSQHLWKTMCYISKKYFTCSTRCNVRARMKLHSHVIFNVHNWSKYHYYNIGACFSPLSRSNWSLRTVDHAIRALMLFVENWSRLSRLISGVIWCEL